MIFRLTVSVSYGVLPVRNSPPPESGRRSMRLSNCSTLKPAIAPLRLFRPAGPVRPFVRSWKLLAGRSVRQSEIAFALEPSNAEHLAETLLEIDIGELQLRLEIRSVSRFGEPERALDHASECLGLAHR